MSELLMQINPPRLDRYARLPMTFTPEAAAKLLGPFATNELALRLLQGMKGDGTWKHEIMVTVTLQFDLEDPDVGREDESFILPKTGDEVVLRMTKLVATARLDDEIDLAQSEQVLNGAGTQFILKVMTDRHPHNDTLVIGTCDQDPQTTPLDVEL